MSTRKHRGKPKQEERRNVEECIMEDPYALICNPSYVCTREDHIKKKNCAKNPWCVYGLGEKDGIWRNNLQVLECIGPDPNEHLRKVDTRNANNTKLLHPAGLKNLGATCYLNVLIQSLFHNLLVQDAILNMETTSSNQGTSRSNEDVWFQVILELQRAFAHMKYSSHGVVDLNHFVELLGLDKNTQQDPQEFNKLFLSSIESANLKQKDLNCMSFNSLLLGKMKYTTTCMSCKTDRDPPHHPFHELDLSIEGSKTIEEALSKYFAVENLRNENQYECSVCKRRCDAERATVIVQTPAMLCLHLLRYGYDRETADRKKLTNEITFPDRLELCGEYYRLTSVLYHKGRSAHGGHYVCDALDWEAGQWWHFDDTTVKETTNPAIAIAGVKPGSSIHETSVNVSIAGEQSSVVSTKLASSNHNVIDIDAMEEETQGSHPEDSDYEDPIDIKTNGKRKRAVAVTKVTGKAKPPAKKRQIVDLNESNKSAAAIVNRKRDAYMLTYIREDEFNACLERVRCEPGEDLREDVQVTSIAYQEEVNKYNTTRSILLQEVETRKEQYKSIEAQLLPEYEVESIQGTERLHPKDFYVVPTDWLSRWIRGDPSTFQSIAHKVKPEISSERASKGNRGVGSGYNNSPEVISLVDMATEDGKVGVEAATIETIDTSEHLHATTTTAKECVGSATDRLSTEIPVLCLMCPHQSGLNTSYLDKLKVISAAAYHTLFESSVSWQRMDYVFTQDTLRCSDCYEGVVEDRRTIYSQLNINLHILNLIESTSTTSQFNNRQNNRHNPTIVLEKEEDIEDTTEPMYCIPRTWLTQFKKITANLQKIENNSGKGKSVIEYTHIFTKTTTKNESKVNDITSSSHKNDYLDPYINTVLLCEHHLPILNYLNRSIKINTYTWKELLKLFPFAKEIKVKSDIYCNYCQENNKLNKEIMDENKNIRQCELNYASLQQLYKRRRIYPDTLDIAIRDNIDSNKNDLIELPTTTYYAVDGLWLAYWRKYISSVHCPAPPVLCNRRLRCVHGKAFLPPLLSGVAQGVPPSEHDPSVYLVQKLGEEDIGEAYTEQKCGSGSSGAYPSAEVVTTEQWEALLEFHRARTHEKKHSSESEVVVLDVDLSNESTEDVMQNKDLFTCQLTRNTTANIHWQWVPEICLECLGAQEEKLIEAVTQYTNARISVVFLREDSEYSAVFHKPLPGVGDTLSSSTCTTPTASKTTTVAATTTAASSTTVSDTPRRTTRRTRGKRLNGHIIADSCDELGIIRLKVYEAFSTVDLPPNEQKLYDSRGIPLSINTKTLSEYGFKAVDTLYVMSGSRGVQADEDWSYLDCFHSTTRGGTEHGFTGTLLQGIGNSSAVASVPNIEPSSSSALIQLQASIHHEASNTSVVASATNKHAQEEEQDGSAHSSDKLHPAPERQSEHSAQIAMQVRQARQQCRTASWRAVSPTQLLFMANKHDHQQQGDPAGGHMTATMPATPRIQSRGRYSRCSNREGSVMQPIDLASSPDT